MINAKIFNISAIKPERQSLTSHSPRPIIQPVSKKSNTKIQNLHARSHQPALTNRTNQSTSVSQNQSNELNSISKSTSINQSNSSFNNLLTDANSYSNKNINDDSISYWVEQIIIHKVDISKPKISSQIDPIIIPKLIASLQSIHNTCIISNRPEESKLADLAIVQLKSLKNRISQNEAIETAKSEVNERLQVVYDERDRMMELLRNQEKKLVAKFDIEKTKLAEKQKKEIQDFEKEWLDENPHESNQAKMQSNKQSEEEMHSILDIEQLESLLGPDEDQNETNDQNQIEDEDALIKQTKSLNRIIKTQDEENIEKLESFLNGKSSEKQQTETEQDETNQIKPSFSKMFEIEEVKSNEQKTSNFDQISHIKQKSKYIDRQTDGYKKERRLRQYNRTSAMLRELRKQTQCLLAEKRYSESRFVNERANKLEKEEVLSMVYQIRHDYEINLLAIEKRHREEQAMLEINHKRKYDEQQKVKQETIEIYNRRIDKLKNELHDAEKGKFRKTNRNITRSSMKRQQTNKASNDENIISTKPQSSISMNNNSTDDIQSINSKDNIQLNDNAQSISSDDNINEINEQTNDEPIMIINSNVQSLISSQNFDFQVNDDNQKNLPKSHSEPEIDMKLSLNRNARRNPYRVTEADLNSGFNLYNGYSFASKINKGNSVNLNSKLNQSINEVLNIDINRSINTANQRNPLMKRRSQPLSCSMPITARRQIKNGEFTSLQLPPLDTKMKVRKAICETQKQFETTKKYM